MEEMDVSKNRVLPQNGWFIMEIPMKMDDLGGYPPIFGNIHMGHVMKQRKNHTPPCFFEFFPREISAACH